MIHTWSTVLTETLSGWFFRKPCHRVMLALILEDLLGSAGGISFSLSISMQIVSIGVTLLALSLTLPQRRYRGLSNCWVWEWDCSSANFVFTSLFSWAYYSGFCSISGHNLKGSYLHGQSWWVNAFLAGPLLPHMQAMFSNCSISHNADHLFFICLTSSSINHLVYN